MAEMEDYLKSYVERTGVLIPGVDERTGHAVASMLAGYRNGIYSGAVRNADRALSFMEKGEYPPVLVKAVVIIKNSSIELSPMQRSMSSSYSWEGKATGGVGKIEDSEITECSFGPGDEKFLALVLPEEKIKVADAYNLNNALALCYAVALNSSPSDEQALQEWVYGFVLARLSDYFGE